MKTFEGVNDSGERQEFSTGSVRDTRTGKGRFDLIPPVSLKRLAQHFENGAVKYGDRNWEKGQPISRYLDSAIRHLYDFLGGDRSEDHLAAAAWNAFAAIHTEQKVADGELPVELNDLEDRVKGTLSYALAHPEMVQYDEDGNPNVPGPYPPVFAMSQVGLVLPDDTPRECIDGDDTVGRMVEAQFSGMESVPASEVLEKLPPEHDIPYDDQDLPAEKPTTRDYWDQHRTARGRAQ
jgi:hypothetical protein